MTTVIYIPLSLSIYIYICVRRAVMEKKTRVHIKWSSRCGYLVIININLEDSNLQENLDKKFNRILKRPEDSCSQSNKSIRHNGFMQSTSSVLPIHPQEMLSRQASVWPGMSL